MASCKCSYINTIIKTACPGRLSDLHGRLPRAFFLMPNCNTRNKTTGSVTNTFSRGKHKTMVGSSENVVYTCGGNNFSRGSCTITTHGRTVEVESRVGSILWEIVCVGGGGTCLILTSKAMFGKVSVNGRKATLKRIIFGAYATSCKRLLSSPACCNRVITRACPLMNGENMRGERGNSGVVTDNCIIHR